MKVVYTHQSLISLEETLNFLIQEQGIPSERVTIIKTQLFNRADSLALNPTKGQREGFLDHLKQDHRRVIEGNI